MPRLSPASRFPRDLAPCCALRGGLPGARWVDPANYHITLRFIGDIDHGLRAKSSPCWPRSGAVTFRLTASTLCHPLAGAAARGGRRCCRAAADGVAGRP